MRSHASLVLLSVLLSACDPAETIYIERPNGQPVLCEGGKKTTYEVLFVVTHPDNRTEVLYEEKTRFTVEPQGGALSTSPDRVSADILSGSMDIGRVPWIQFYVYCGQSKDPFLVTPRIMRSDLRKIGNATYLYVVE
jgi:hypothetical protein